MDCPIKSPLISLHCHSQYSILDGVSSIDEYVDHTKDIGAPALGLTDHGGMIGLMELYQKCKKAGITPMPGVEAYLVPQSGHEFKKKPYDYFHICIWATNQVGYRNLLKLGSLSYADSLPDGRKRVVKKVGVDKPRLTFDEILEHNEGLVVGSACVIGPLNKPFLQGEFGWIEKNLNKLLEVYRNRFFIEVLPVPCSMDYDRKTKAFVKNPNGDIQLSCNNQSIELAKKHNIPILMTTDSHFVNPDQKSLQNVMLQNGDPSGWTFFESYHARTTQDAWDYWQKTYGTSKETTNTFIDAIENGHELASRAKDFEIKDSFHQPEVNIPEDIRTSFKTEDDQLSALLLRKVDEHGRMRWDDPKYVDRLRTELNVICRNGIINFSRYFLFMEHWNKWTRDNSVLSAPGRGSGAGSLLCYLLKITHLDPFALDLPFERFLSMGRLRRNKWPDLDWDQGQRDLLISQLIETYGDKTAQCSTLGTLKVKSAIKDACRVMLGWSSSGPEVEAITKTIPQTPTGVDDEKFLLGHTDSDGVEHEGHIDTNPTLKRFFDNNKEVYEMVLRLLGIPRSIGRHASAYLVSDRPLYESVPTCNIGGNIVTQYTAGPCEKAGLIKFDLLRVNTLSDISGCIRMVQQRMGYKVVKTQKVINKEPFDIWHGDLDITQLPMPDGNILDIYQLPPDPAVFGDFSEGKTETVFQMSTPLLTGFCKRMKPKSIHDLAALVALVRPGPLTADTGIPTEDPEVNYTMTEAYLACRDGKIPVKYAHQGLEPILSDTYGQIVYQEQLQRAFSDLVGYSPEEADFIRELIAKKKKDDMEKTLPEIRRRLVERGWNEEQIKVLINSCIASASYSFNKSHSYSYCTVSYQCMFLKHHFPLEWWTSVLQNAKVEDIRDKGYAYAIKDILVLPHVNGPMDTFELRDGKVHSPLYLIDGIGDAACRIIRDEKERSGDFKSFQDFYERTKGRAVDLGIVHSLILCGAFSNICPLGPRELISLYHSFRRVQELKIGKDKKGLDLLKAVEGYLSSGKTVNVPEVYMDNVELEVLRLKLLPIYRMDVHEVFKKTLEQKSFLYDSRGVVTCRVGGETTTVLRNIKCIPNLKSDNVAWAGLIKSAEEFRFKDKKTGKQVTALKCQVVNDGDSLECVFWPQLYSKHGMPKNTKIFIAKGILRESREPGKFSLYVQAMDQI